MGHKGEEMYKVIEINDERMKIGKGRKGAYVMAPCRLKEDDGNIVEATIFKSGTANIAVGDEVEVITYNEQYDNSSGWVADGKKGGNSGNATRAILDRLEDVFKQNEQIIQLLMENPSETPLRASQPPKSAWEQAGEKFAAKKNKTEEFGDADIPEWVADAKERADNE